MISQRSGRYVLPIKKEFRKQVKGNVLDESGSGQTVYIEPAEIISLQFDQSANMAEESKEEMKVLGDLTALTESYSRELSINTETVGIIDFVLAKAKYAKAIDAVPVELNLNGIIDIRGARHPLMANSMVPLDFSIGEGYSSLIITGPNTGGKTMALKSVGLNSDGTIRTTGTCFRRLTNGCIREHRGGYRRRTKHRACLEHLFCTYPQHDRNFGNNRKLHSDPD